MHPATPDNAVQGNLELYYTLQRSLSEIGGMAEFTLNPFAGAHGELTGLMVIRAYHERTRRQGAAQITCPILPTARILLLPLWRGLR